MIILLGWLATGLYRVNADERGVVLRFGAYTQTTGRACAGTCRGRSRRSRKVGVTRINTTIRQQTRMLTADENIVVVDLVVQYQNADPVKYLFEVLDPDATLSDVSESAIREVIGKNPADFVLLEGRAEIAVQTQALIQETLDEYGAGIMVTKVNLQDTTFPSQVEAAVQDAIKAREDKERWRSRRSRTRTTSCRRRAARPSGGIQDAEAYKAASSPMRRVRRRGSSSCSRSTKRRRRDSRRLYIEAIEDVLYANSSKVLLDAEGSGNLLYLPIDKLLEQRIYGSGQKASGRNRRLADHVFRRTSTRPADDPRVRRTR